MHGLTHERLEGNPAKKMTELGLIPLRAIAIGYRYLAVLSSISHRTVLELGGHLGGLVRLGESARSDHL